MQAPVIAIQPAPEETVELLEGPDAGVFGLLDEARRDGLPEALDLAAALGAVGRGVDDLAAQARHDELELLGAVAWAVVDVADRRPSSLDYGLLEGVEEAGHGLLEVPLAVGHEPAVVVDEADEVDFFEGGRDQGVRQREAVLHVGLPGVVDAGGFVAREGAAGLVDGLARGAAPAQVVGEGGFLEVAVAQVLDEQRRGAGGELGTQPDGLFKLLGLEDPGLALVVPAGGGEGVEGGDGALGQGLHVGEHPAVQGAACDPALAAGEGVGHGQERRAGGGGFGAAQGARDQGGDDGEACQGHFLGVIVGRHGQISFQAPTLARETPAVPSRTAWLRW